MQEWVAPSRGNAAAGTCQAMVHLAHARCNTLPWPKCFVASGRSQQSQQHQWVDAAVQFDPRHLRPCSWLLTSATMQLAFGRYNTATHTHTHTHTVGYIIAALLWPHHWQQNLELSLFTLFSWIATVYGGSKESKTPMLSATGSFYLLFTSQN